MTLTEALAALQAAGKIKSAWLPGMLVKDSLGRTARKTGFQPPEATLVGHRTMEASQAQPVLTDAATVGCLLALVREASGEPHAETGYEEGETVDGWCVRAGDGEADWQLAQGDAYLWPTEGEAIAAALIALAGDA